jgi:hypothetical protein
MRARVGAQVVARDLSPAHARLTWIRAHQLERLGLPALRPVRLDGGRVELLRPEGASAAPPEQSSIAIARRQLGGLGHFVSEPHWMAVGNRAWLVNPEAFELLVRAWYPRGAGQRRGVNGRHWVMWLKSRSSRTGFVVRSS